jgi:AcrR family transcriptional regulator
MAPKRVTQHRDKPPIGPIAEIQRARLIAAITQVCGERGADSTTVADVVGRAGVSRRTFYELFPDRDACFLAAFDQAARSAAERVREVYDPEESWPARIRAALMALLEFAEDEPALGRLLLLESLRAGPAVIERRARLVEQIGASLEAGGAESAGRGPEPLSLAGAALAIVQARLSAQEHPELRALTGPLMALIVLPYLGASASGRELARPLPPRREREAPASMASLASLDLRITQRTMMVLQAIATLGGREPGPSNREVAEASGIVDQGQASKLLRRLERIGLIQTSTIAKGAANAWTLTTEGANLVRAAREVTGGEQGLPYGERIAPSRSR